MAQITAVPVATLVVRQDLSSLIGDGISFLNSIFPQTTDTATDSSSSTTSSTTSSSSSTSDTSTKTTASTSHQTSSSSTSASETSSASSSTSLSSLGALQASSSPSASNTASSSNHSTPVLPIVLGVVLGVLLLAIVAFLLICCHRRQKNKNGHALFRRSRRTETPISDGDYESFNQSMTENNHVYPIVPPPHQLSQNHGDNISYGHSGYHQQNANYGPVPSESPFDDNYRSGYDRRSVRSSSLDPVPEYVERTPRRNSEPYMNRKFAPRPLSGGSGGGAPWVPPPPRSPQRPGGLAGSIPRRPVSSSALHADSGFDFGLGGGSKYGENGRHSGLSDAHHRF